MAKLETVFVTGATGFLGSHLVECLAHRGAAISILARGRPDRLSQEIPRLNVVRGDLSHAFSISDASTVFHLAAQAHVGHALDDPSQTFETNTAGTITVLEAVRRSPSVEKFVFVSTAHVYGTPRIHFLSTKSTPFTLKSPTRQAS